MITQLFSRDELRDIFIAIVALTVIFSFPNFQNLLLPAFVIVVTSFLLHELAHKFAAIKFGVAAFFKMWPLGILIGLIFMFTFLKFVAPGAVVIYPYRFGKWKRKYEKYSRFTEITIKQLGVIAVVGPLVNIALAGIFSLIPGTFFTYLVLINSWLAFINLLPVNPLDGAKVFVWKPWFWFLLILISLIFLITTAPAFFG